VRGIGSRGGPPTAAAERYRRPVRPGGFTEVGWGFGICLGRRGGSDRPAPGLLPPAAAMIPEDQGVAVGRVFRNRPLAEAVEDLRIAGVALA